MFSSEFCKISKNIFSYKTPPVAASVVLFMFLLVFLFFWSDFCIQDATDSRTITVRLFGLFLIIFQLSDLHYHM